MVFAIFTITPLISESLLGNTRVTVEIFKSAWAPFHKKTNAISVILIFRESIFNCDDRCFSHKFMSPPITDAVYFITSASENG